MINANCKEDTNLSIRIMLQHAAPWAIVNQVIFFENISLGRRGISISSQQEFENISKTNTNQLN